MMFRLADQPDNLFFRRILQREPLTAPYLRSIETTLYFSHLPKITSDTEGTTIPLRRITRSSRPKPAPAKLPSPAPPAGDESSESIPAFNYGRFTFDYAVNFAGLSISLEQTQGLYHYRRAIGSWVREANVSSSNGRMLIHPVEPLYVPDAVTDFLEIRFEEIMIEPNGKTVLFLTFPIEIGVFIDSKGKADVIDVFTFKPPKYSLYGASNRGVITRWHQSKVYYYPPQVKNYEDGVLRLTIENSSGDWVYVSRVILYEKGMYVYYDDQVVSMAAEMTIVNRETADVTGVDRPLHEDMTRSLRMYRPRRTTSFANIPGAVIDTTFTMDSGLI